MTSSSTRSASTAYPPRVTLGVALVLLACAGLCAATPALAEEPEVLAFTVTASGQTNKTLAFDSGCHDAITMNLTCTLQVRPHALSCDEERFHSDSADVTGTIHYWGVARSDCVGSLNFDITEPIRPSASATTSSFTPADADYFYVIAQDDVFVPGREFRAYWFEYVSSLHVLRIWIALPNPYRYASNLQHYDFPASHTVTGTEDVPSCLIGTVADAETGKGVPDALVTFGGQIRHADAAGRFQYERIPANSYRLLVSQVGYGELERVEDIPPFSILHRTYPLGRSELAFIDANPMFLGGFDVTKGLDPAADSSILQLLAESSTERTCAATDGTTLLIARYTAAKPGTVDFALDAGEAEGTLTALDGRSAPQGIRLAAHAKQYFGFALYRVPAGRSAWKSTTRIHAVQTIEGGDREQQEQSALLRLSWPPVVMVHGVWAGAETWAKLDQTLRAEGFEHLWRVAWGVRDHAAGPFAAYRGVVTGAARRALDSLRSGGCAASQVMIVAHSMGGLLTRQDANDPDFRRPENFGEGYFDRLITVDTPHFGSSAATVLRAVSAEQPWLGSLLRKAGHPIDGGAVSDLDPESFAGSLATAGQAAGLAATWIPAVAMAGSVSEIPPWSGEFIIHQLGWKATREIALVSPLRVQEIFCGHSVGDSDTVFSFASKIFARLRQDGHDGIVSFTSQLGGAGRTIRHAETHTMAPQSPDVLKQIVGLLQSDLKPFDEAGFPAVNEAALATQRCSRPALAPLSGVGLQPSPRGRLIRFVTPSPGTVIPSGSPVQVLLENVPGQPVTGVLTMSLIGGTILGIEAQESLPLALSVTVPTNRVGKVQVFAVGFARGAYDLEELEFRAVAPSHAVPVSLNLRPASLHFSGAGETEPLVLTCHYSDGSVRDVTPADAGTLYESSYPEIASVDGGGRITSASNGVVTVVATYGGLKSEIPVTVRLEVPMVLSVTPMALIPGTEVNLTIVGERLGNPRAVSFLRDGRSDPNLVLEALTWDPSGLNLRGRVRVSADAPIGLRTVVVATAGGTSARTDAQGSRLFIGTPLILSVPTLEAVASGGYRLNLHVTGQSGASCLVEHSPDLVGWAPLSSLVLKYGTGSIPDTRPAGASRHFYRAVLNQQ